MNSKLLVSPVLLLGLTACIEVDNGDVNESLAQQNEILTQQNDILSASQVDKVTLSGNVINRETQADVTNATIKYKVGITWSEPVPIVDGQFEITDLPSASQIRLLIESTDNAFMPRELSGTTIYADGTSYQEVNGILVYPAKTYSFSVFDKETLEPVTDLKFEAEIDSGHQFERLYYSLNATYNEDSKLYHVTAPDYYRFNELQASADTDMDGTLDYHSNNYSGRISIGYDQIIDEQPLLVEKMMEAIEIQPKSLKVRLSVLNSNVEPLLKAEPVVINDLTAEDSTLLAEYSQYELNVELTDYLEIKIPAFSENDMHYDSTSVQLQSIDSGSIRVTTQLATNYLYSKSYDINLDDSGIVDIVVKPIETDTNQSDARLAEVITYSQNADSQGRHKLFFSSPVTPIDNFYNVIQEGHMEVVRGNDDPNDMVLPGNTVVSMFDKVIDATVEMSLNDTLLSFGPTAGLEQGTRYRYNITSVTDKRANSTVSVEKTFTVNPWYDIDSMEEFNINQLILDNGNYTTNGALITSHNTAGTENSFSEYGSSAYLYFPESIRTLKNLTLQKTLTTQDGTSSNSLQTYNIVENSVIGANKRFVVKVAENEQVSSNSYGMTLGTTLSDGWHYRTGSFSWFNDDKAGSENSITFDYAYETLSGEIHTGTITIPVK